MIQTEVDKPNNLLKFTYSQHVTPEETRHWREKIPGLLSELRPGFKLFNDFSGVTAMDHACAPDVEAAMEMFNKAGIEKVVRVITHPRQDIGLSIMSLFHYRRCISIVTTDSLAAGLAALAD